MRPGVSNSLAVVLKLTALPEAYVLLSAVLVAALAVAALQPKIRMAAVRKIFAWLCVVIVLGTALALVLVPGTVQEMSREGHVFEWLTAHLLLAAWVIGVVIAVRLTLQNTPSPMTVFLTFGYFLAFWREIEWGEPFFGEKLWYSRFLFRPKAYISAAPFAKQAQSIGMSPEYLHTVHLIFAPVILLAVVAVILYLIRHRDLFIRELRKLPQTSCGRFFLAGAGVYLISQGLERLFKHLLATPWLADWSMTHRVSKSVLGEGVELVASLACLVSMVALWHDHRSRAPASGPRPS